MKKYIVPLILSLAGVIGFNTVRAATVFSYYYDQSVSTAWTTATLSWSTLAAGGGTKVAWPVPWDATQTQNTTSGTYYNAFFCATDQNQTGTYTVSPGNAVVKELGGITFSTGNCTLAPGAGGFYFCNGGGSITVPNSSQTCTITELFGGAIGFYKDGPGTLIIAGDNAHSTVYNSGPLTGVCHLRSGTLALGNNGALGTGTFYMDCTTTAAYVQASTSGINIPNKILFNQNGSFSGSISMTWSGTFDFGSGASSLCALQNTADLLVTGATSSDNGGGGTAGGIILSGSGRIVFSNGANAHKGDIVVNGPVVKVTNTSGNAGGTGAVTLNGSTVTGSGTLTGSGIVGTVNVNSMGVLAPGDFPNLTAANLLMGTLNLAAGGAYKCVITAPTGSAGVNWSLASCSTLNVNSSSGSPCILDVSLANSGTPGLPAGFNPAQSYTWQILAASSAINNFAANKFRVACSVLPPEAFSIQRSGNNLNLVYTPPATAATAGVSGLSGQFFNAASPTNSLVKLARIDSTIDFESWTADQQPAQEINGDNWSVQWSGLLVPAYSETYTIYTRSDDGSSVYIAADGVNETQVVNNWFSQGMTTRSGTIALTAGVPVPIRVTYYNGGGGEGVILAWSSPSVSSNVIPASALYASPYITTQPVSDDANPSDSVTFSVAAASGSFTAVTNANSSTSGNQAPITYQWQKNGVNIAGATGTSYNVPSAGFSDAAGYTVVVGNNAACQLSSTAYLTLPQIVTFNNPGDQTYGVLPLSSLGGSVDSGLPVNYSVLSGPATITNATSGNLQFTGVGSVTIQAGQPGDASHRAATPVPQTFNVNPATLTVTVSGTKVYGPAAPVYVPAFTGFFFGDTPAVISGSANFTTTADAASPVSGNPYVASVADFGNLSAANYTFVIGAPGTMTVTASPITPSITAANKTYDSTLAATITSRSLSPIYNGDDVNPGTSGTATFATKVVATGKTVTATGLALNGSSAGNYTLTSASAATTADIALAPLTVSGIVVNNKAYDGNTNATLVTAAATLIGKLGSDDVTLITTNAVGYFRDPEQATNKTVDISGLFVVGADIGNYSLTQPTATANITAGALTVSGIVASDKVYDTIVTASLDASSVSNAVLNGVAPGEDVTLIYTNGSGDFSAYAVFTDKNAGTNKTVIVLGLDIVGADASKYSLGQVTTTNTIAPAPLVVSATGIDKTYDATTAATVTLAATPLAGDSITPAYASAVFDSKDVGIDKAVTVSGITVGGTDGANYAPNSTASATANVSQAPITVTATGIDKTYDGTAGASVTLSATPLLTDSIIPAYAAASFDNKNVGVGKPVSVSGITVGGTDGANYSPDSTASTTASITNRVLVFTATGVSKAYDCSTTASVSFSDDRVAGDVLTYGYTASFADGNVGTGKAVGVSAINLSGTDFGNYMLTNTTASVTADITARMLSITANNFTRVYGAPNPTFTGVISGLQSCDTITATYACSATTTSCAGTYPIVVTVSDPNNYLANYAATTNNGTLTVHANAFVDSFETYNTGDIDKNEGGGPNAAACATGNPWFGPNPGNIQVVTAENGVTPHSGAKMARGKHDVVDNDEDWYNLIYRMNGGNNYFGNIVFEWWFYDPAGTGSGDVNYNDYNALVEYGSVPTGSDYNCGTPAANDIGYVSGGQRLSLGALSTQAGLDATKYQARIVGASDGATATGWFNLGVTRSVGWHHARIVIGAANGASTPAAFFIDNMTTALLTHALTTTTGFNLLELGGSYGSVSGYYDDVVFQEGAYAPAISGLVSQTNNPGDTVTLAATVVGSPCNIQYYWQKNGVTLSDGGNIGGSSTPTLVITGAGASDATAYSLVASNIAGVTTASANLVLNQTIAFPPVTDQTYGTPLSLSALAATANSGLAVTYSVASGPATISGGDVVFSGTGAVTLQADQGGNAFFTPALPAQQTFNVNAAALTITANNASKVYGQTVTFAGTEFTTSTLYNSDSVTSVALASDGAAPTAPVSGSPYAIVPSSAAGVGLGNYNIAYVNGSLTVTAGGSSSSLVSSLNPSTETSNVTFTATVSAVAPAAGTPGGPVVFLAGGVPFSTNMLVGGVAAASTTSLPVGTNSIIAQYTGDGNFLTSSSTAVQQVVNSLVTDSTNNLILSIVSSGSSAFVLNCQGTPGALYYVAASPDMSTWTPLTDSTNTAPSPSGIWSCTVSNPAPAFFRSVAINPAK